MPALLRQIPLYLLISIALGLLARAVLSFETQFWLDELWSAGFSHPDHSLAQVIKLTLDDVHPPLFQILLHGWLTVFGFSEMSARGFSLLVGTIAVIVFRPFARSFYPDKRADIATALFAINLFAITFTAEVRSYQLLLLFSLLNGYFLFRYLFEGQKSALIGYVIFSIMAIYTHYFGVILLLSHALIMLVALIKRRDKTLFLHATLTYSTLLICWLPLLSSVLADVNRESFWIENPSFLLLLAYVPVFFGGPLALTLLLPLSRIKKAWPDHGYKEGSLLIAALAILLIPYLIGFLIHPIQNPRNAIISLPFWILWISFFIPYLSCRWQQIFIALSMIACLIGTALVLPNKGEHIDLLLSTVMDSEAPLYVVNGGKLATDGFLRTKQELNQDRYRDLSIRTWNGDAIDNKHFWLACYHTCNEIDLNSYIPRGFTVTDQLEGKAVKALLLEEQSAPAF